MPVHDLPDPGARSRSWRQSAGLSPVHRAGGLLLSAAVVGCVYSVSPRGAVAETSTATSGEFRTPFHTSSGEIKHFSIAGQVFNIPLPYLESVYQDPSPKPGALLLARWPSFQGYFTEPVHPSVPSLRLHDLLIIEFHPLGAQPGLDYRLAALSALYKTTVEMPRQYGLEHLAQSGRASPGDEGMEMFIDRSEHVHTLIVCGPQRVNTSCHESFMFGIFLADVHYSIPLNSEWQYIEKRTRDILTGFLSH